MLALAGFEGVTDRTAIEKQLRISGRLTGSQAQPDYDFNIPALNHFYRHIEQSLDSWVHGSNSVSNHLNAAWDEVAVLRRLFPEVNGLLAYESFLRNLTKSANELIFSEIENSAKSYSQANKFKPLSYSIQDEAEQEINTLLEHRDQFIFNNQSYLLESIATTNNYH